MWLLRFNQKSLNRVVLISRMDIKTMSRARKDGKHVNFYIKTSISDLLDRYCDEVGQTKTEATERILKKFLDNHFMQKSLAYGESVNK